MVRGCSGVGKQDESNRNQIMVAWREGLEKETRVSEDDGRVLCFDCGGCYMGVLCVFGETH